MNLFIPEGLYRASALTQSIALVFTALYCAIDFVCAEPKFTKGPNAVPIAEVIIQERNQPAVFFDLTDKSLFIFTSAFANGGSENGARVGITLVNAYNFFDSNKPALVMGGSYISSYGPLVPGGWIKIGNKIENSWDRSRTKEPWLFEGAICTDRTKGTTIGRALDSDLSLLDKKYKAYSNCLQAGPLLFENGKEFAPTKSGSNYNLQRRNFFDARRNHQVLCQIKAGESSSKPLRLIAGQFFNVSLREVSEWMRRELQCTSAIRLVGNRSSSILWKTTTGRGYRVSSDREQKDAIEENFLYPTVLVFLDPN